MLWLKLKQTNKSWFFFSPFVQNAAVQHLQMASLLQGQVQSNEFEATYTVRRWSNKLGYDMTLAVWLHNENPDWIAAWIDINTLSDAHPEFLTLSEFYRWLFLLTRSRQRPSFNLPHSVTRDAWHHHVPLQVTDKTTRLCLLRAEMFSRFFTFNDLEFMSGGNVI